MLKKSRTISVILSMVVAFSLVSCGNGNKKASNANHSTEASQNYNDILSKAKGETVNFYGWGGNEDLNKWLDTVVAPEVKSKYNITFKRVPMDIDTVLNKLSTEKQAGKTNGTIDMIWINGENFYSAKENKLLYGPFTNLLPNENRYVDINSKEITQDFCYPTSGFEAPFAKAQMVMINDSSKTSETPKNCDELLDFAEKYKGKVTYPAPPDFIGSAFVRNIIYDKVGYDKLENLPADKEQVKTAIMPAMEYLRELNKYLWKEGKTFPSTSSQVDNMYADGELNMTMSYDPLSVAVQMQKGVFSDTSRSFVFDRGMVSNTNFIAIAGNSPNKDAAIVVINELLSPKIQESKYENVKMLPAISYNKLSDADKKTFDNAKVGKGVLTEAVLSTKRVPELKADLVPIIEQIWEEEVVGK